MDFREKENGEYGRNRGWGNSCHDVLKNFLNNNKNLKIIRNTDMYIMIPNTNRIMIIK